MPAIFRERKRGPRLIGQVHKYSTTLELRMNENLYEEDKGPGFQSKKVAVMVGRMNPPTRGHYKVINAMKAFIRDNPKLGLEASPIVVIVAGSKSDADKKRNPLSGEERQTFMSSSGNANGVKFLIAPNAFAAFAKVREAGFEPIAVAAGEDRAPEYTRILDKHFTDGGKPVKHHIISLDRDFDTEHEDGDAYFSKVIDMINDGDKVDDNQISGSLARYAVKNDEQKAFAYITGLEKKPKLASTLFKKVKEALSVA